MGGIITNKKFWTTFKSFLTNKGNIFNNYIGKDGELLSNEKNLLNFSIKPM